MLFQKETSSFSKVFISHVRAAPGSYDIKHRKGIDDEAKLLVRQDRVQQNESNSWN